MTELEEARRLLPEWVRYTLWMVPPYLAVSGYCLTRLVAARGLRALPDSPWTERARVNFPVRLMSRITRFLHLMMGVWVVALTTHSWVAGPAALRVIVTLAASFAGALLAAVGLDARVQGESRSAILRSWFATTLLLFAPVYVIIGFWALGASFAGPVRVALNISGFVVAMVLGLGYTSSLAVLAGVARPARANVAAAVERASTKLGVRVRRVLEYDSVFCNAFAFPVIRRIAFSTRTAEIMDDAELEAIAAHELGHLDEPVYLRAFRPLVLLLLCFVLLLSPLLFRQTLTNVAIELAAMIATVFVARVLARRGEKHADSYANGAGFAYASALQKLARHNFTPLVLPRPGAHGHPWDRIVAAGHALDIPKPAPPAPPRLAWRLALAFTVVVPLAAFIVCQQRDDSPSAARTSIALGGRSDDALEQLAREAGGEERFDDAATFYRAAQVLAPKERFYSFALTIALSNSGKCEEARSEFERVGGTPKSKSEVRLTADASRALRHCYERKDLNAALSGEE